MESKKTFRVLVEDHVARLLLDAPPVNCITSQVLTDLDAVTDELRGLNDLRAVVLGSSHPRIFSAGADIKQFSSWDAAAGEAASSYGSRVYRRLSAIPVPVICAVNGGAYGGGLELALACDIRFFESTAKVGFPESGLGVLPGYGGTQRLPRLIGRGSAGLVLYSGRILDGNAAYDLGICDAVTEPGRVWDEALKLAGEIAAKAPAATRAIKECIEFSEKPSVEAGFEREDVWFGRLCDTADKREGVDAFLGKREPEFTGR